MIVNAVPAWVVMWLLAIGIFGSCKIVTWQLDRRAPAAWWRHVAYLVAWPGMDASSFLTRRSCRPVGADEWARGLGCSAIGLLLFFGVARYLPPTNTLTIGWVGMAGLVLSLHFGAFQLVSCAWRRAGADARPLMDRPLLSTSLGEFWGRRWNSAFRDLTHRFLFRPLLPLVGSRLALLASFVASGAVHELVISVPAGGGYGGPTAYFAIQGAGLLTERSRFGQRLRLASAARGRAFTMLVLFAPLCMLFHPPFVERVVVPFMRAGGAL